jgi:hypothetical protein
MIACVDENGIITRESPSTEDKPEVHMEDIAVFI